MVRQLVPEAQMPLVILGYSNALTKTFVISAALAPFTVVRSAFVEWKSVKGKPMEPTAA